MKSFLTKSILIALPVFALLTYLFMTNSPSPAPQEEGKELDRMREVVLHSNALEEAKYGIRLFEKGEYQESIKYFDKAIKMHPNSPMAYECYANKGLALAKLGKDKEAIETLDLMVKMEPTKRESYYIKGLVLLDTMNKYQESLDAFNEAIKIDPNWAELYFRKGASLENLGKFQDAVDAYSKAIKLDPHHEDFYIHKTRALYNAGKIDEVIKTFQEGLEANPDSQALKDDMEHFKEWIAGKDKHQHHH